MRDIASSQRLAGRDREREQLLAAARGQSATPRLPNTTQPIRRANTRRPRSPVRSASSTAQLGLGAARGVGAGEEVEVRSSARPAPRRADGVLARRAGRASAASAQRAAQVAAVQRDRALQRERPGAQRRVAGARACSSPRTSQLEKFRERLERSDKYFKWSDNDMRERAHWEEYQRVDEDGGDGTVGAHVRPGGWYPQLVSGRGSSRVDPRYPAPPADVKAFAERELERAR